MDQIEAVYREHYWHFVRVATAIVGDPDSGHDAVHDGFAQAISKRLDYRDEAPLEAWLWRVVINSARDKRRRAVLATSIAQEVTEASIDYAAEHQRAAIRRGVASLPSRQRQVIFLRYYADLSYSQIGDALQIHTGTVSATLSAAHRALAQLACQRASG